MLVGPLRSRDLLVRNVADERMSKDVLVLACDRAPAISRHELLSRKRVQSAFERPALATEGSQPEDSPDHGCVLEQRLLLGRQRVEPGGDDALHGLREHDLARARDEHPSELLGIERVASGVLEQPRLQVGVERRTAEERMQEPSGLFVGERRQQDRRRVHLSAAPTRPPGEELGASGREHQDRDAARPLDQVVHEVEEHVVGPVQVLEDENERSLVGDRLEQAAPGGKRLVAPVACPRIVGLEPDERAYIALDPAGVGRIVDEPLHGLTELLPSLLAPSDSRIPACALTISRSAQKVTPSPYGSERPWRQKTSPCSPVSIVWKSSKTSRLLPIPGTPTSVTSCDCALADDAGERPA